MSHTDLSFRSIRAFTAIEMVAVLFLLGMMAGMAALSLSGPRQSAEMNEVLDHVGWCDALVRRHAVSQHAPARLVIDAGAGSITEIDSASGGDPTPRTLYQLPHAYQFGQVTRNGASVSDEPNSIAISAGGLSPSYAVQITYSNQSRWALIAGLSGQLVQVKDEQEISNLFDRLGGNGHDAR